jgi:hypothetical protein
MSRKKRARVEPRSARTHFPQNEVIIVSVESRKGGVGKTTAALNIAKSLLERKRRVLFLDADITGTNVLHVLASPFWRPSCEPVRLSPSTGQESADPADLVTLFSDGFMSGRGVPGFVFTKDRPPAGCLTARADRISVLGSSQASADSAYPPSVLFDDLHSFLFIEFIQQLCDAFLKASRSDGGPSSGIAIVVDNSPGYIGIAPALRGWLTDLGPERGKFLFVSSLDRQDVMACDDSMDSLHKLYRAKWQGSREYAMPTTAPSEDFVDSEQGAFYLRLAESESQRGDSTSPIAGTDLTFYREESEARGKYFDENPSAYLGIIINRVPEFITSSSRAYDITELSSIVDRWVGPASSVGSSKRSPLLDFMVTYRQSIELQFSGKWIRRNRNARHLRKKDLVHQLMRFTDIKRKEWYVTPIISTSPESLSFDSRRLAQLRSQIRTIDRTVDVAIGMLNGAGLSDLARLLKPEWRPGAILSEFQGALGAALAYSDISARMLFPAWEEETGPASDEAGDFLRSLYGRVWAHLGAASSHVEPSREVGQFAASLVPLVALSLTSPLWHEEVGSRIVALCARTVLIQGARFVHSQESEGEKASIQRFLATEAESTEFPEDSDWDRRYGPPASSAFYQFYRTSCRCQARLTDLLDDAQFILEIVRCLAMYASSQEDEDSLSAPDIEDTAADVIIHKRMTHGDARSWIGESFARAFEMREFHETVERIMLTWLRQLS